MQSFQLLNMKANPNILIKYKFKSLNSVILWQFWKPKSHIKLVLFAISFSCNHACVPNSRVFHSHFPLILGNKGVLSLTPRSDTGSQLQLIFAILLNQEIPLWITTPKNQLTFQYWSWNKTIQKSHEFELKFVAGFKQLEVGKGDMSEGSILRAAGLPSGEKERTVSKRMQDK